MNESFRLSWNFKISKCRISSAESVFSSLMINEKLMLQTHYFLSLSDRKRIFSLTSVIWLFEILIMSFFSLIGKILLVFYLVIPDHKRLTIFGWLISNLVGIFWLVVLWWDIFMLNIEVICMQHIELFGNKNPKIVSPLDGFVYASHMSTFCKLIW